MWPSPLYVTTKSEKVITITGAKYRAREPEDDVCLGDVHRDDPQGLLNVPPVQAAQLAAAYPGENASLNNLGGVALYAGDALAINAAGTQSSTPAVYASDLVLHIDPRKTKRKIDYWRWYDSAPLLFACTTVSAGNSLVVPAGTEFTVGMGVSGTNIRSGSVIVSIVDDTHVLLSQPMTASAIVNVTFTGNMVGEVPVNDYLAASGSLPAYL